MEHLIADQEHRNQVAEQMSATGRKHFKFIEFDKDEELVTEIHKHPIGLVFILLVGAFALFAILAFTILLSITDLDSALNASANNLKPVIVLIGFLLALAIAAFTGIAVWLYVNNAIFVTSEKIAQVLYITLFNRKVSQLSIGDVQDATVTQKGILSHIFNYGTLIIETAGEQQNYTFSYIPDPYVTAQKIVGAHERNLVHYGN